MEGQHLVPEIRTASSLSAVGDLYGGCIVVRPNHSAKTVICTASTLPLARIQFVRHAGSSLDILNVDHRSLLVL